MRRGSSKVMGLGGKEGSFPNELSGGEAQRVAIARALANDPGIILADEPTGNLDSRSGRQVLDILEDLNQLRRVTVVVVTHDESIAREARRRVRLKDGRIEPAPIAAEHWQRCRHWKVRDAMKFSEVLTLSKSNLNRQKGRSALATIGIAVGVATVIALMTLATSFQTYFTTQYNATFLPERLLGAACADGHHHLRLELRPGALRVSGAHLLAARREPDRLDEHGRRPSSPTR